MRYIVVPMREGMTLKGFGIWDQKLSPELHDAGVEPAFCSLDGEHPLVFGYMAGAYRWLARCERAGLDLEGKPGSVDVYSVGNGEDGAVMVRHRPVGRSTDRVVREWPAIG